MPIQLDIETGEPIKPWDRQPGEKGKPYTCFRHYMGQGPQRTLAATSRWWTEQNGRVRAGTEATGRIRAWSSEFRWVERAEAWDRAEARRIEAELAEQRRLQILATAERHRTESEILSRLVMRIAGKANEELRREGGIAANVEAQVLLENLRAMMGHLPKLHADERIALSGSPENYAAVISPPAEDATEDDELIDLESAPWLLKRAQQVGRSASSTGRSQPKNDSTAASTPDSKDSAAR